MRRYCVEGQCELGGLLSANAELRADVARLRSALKEIAEIPNELYSGDWEEIDKAREISNAALAVVCNQENQV